MVDVVDLLVLSCVPEIGPGRLLSLVTEFGNPRRVLEADPRDLSSRGRLPQGVATAVARFRRTTAHTTALRFAETQLASAHRTGCTLLTYWDERYPDLLRNIADPPPILFVRGGFTADDRCSLAVVGTRKPSPYGIAAAQRFARELARFGIPVTSGLARGIDTAAHAAALAEGGRTHAVIGSGLDVIYPPENLSLALRIAGQGAVVSECVMGARPAPANFPRRNRLISGLTLGTIVIESAVDGGAMITARSALEQNREVFAVPSEITHERGRGTNRLIREGSAKLVETIEDVLEELVERFRAVGRAPAPGHPVLTLPERRLLEALTGSPETLARIARQARLPLAEALAILEDLASRKRVRRLPGNRFARPD